MIVLKGCAVSRWLGFVIYTDRQLIVTKVSFKKSFFKVKNTLKIYKKKYIEIFYNIVIDTKN